MEKQHWVRGVSHLRFALFLCAMFGVSSATAAAKTKLHPGPSNTSKIEIAAPLADVLKAVEEVAADPIVHGTYVYEHDKTLTGARRAEVSSAFGNDKPAGKVIYKVVENVIAPRHFKDTEDTGTITVRYVVQEIGPTSTSIRIDAVFIESARRAVHASEGAVESAEFGEIQRRINRVQAEREEAVEEEKDQARVAQASTGDLATQVGAASPIAPTPRATAPSITVPSKAELAESSGAGSSVQELEQRVDHLRHQVEARVKAPGAPLKSAPFQTATTIQTVPAESEVAIVILTSYWYGVQTPDGHRGWIRRSQLEPLP